VKVRGFRIELGEVEAALDGHEAVREAVVVVREDDGGEKRLVAYVVGEDGQEVGGGELRRYLKEKLPEYMIPSVFVHLAELPLTASGKVDRRSLPAPEPTRETLEGEYVAPRTAEEEIIAGIWAQVLKVEEVGVEDNFFALGGHSLLATQVMSRVRNAFHVELSLRYLFEEPTVAGLAARITQRQGEQGEPTDEHIDRQPSQDVERLLENLDRLSDQEVGLLLSDLLAEEEGN
jgi:acyl carrier protein